MPPIIEVEKLTKRYGSRAAVNDVSFSLEPGAVFGFIGPNGAGKTTTIRILTTLLNPTTGQVRVGGYLVTREPMAVRKIVGYMPDFFGVYTDMTVWEYLDFFSACYNIPPPQRPGLVKDLLELVDLSHRKNDFVDSLSRGMKQRLCLARALVHDPKILVLDEPASGLDPRARVEFRDLLTELRHMGKTIFLSSHILADIAEICTEVGIIEAGRMVTHGNIEEMKRRLRQNHYLRIRVLDDYLEQAQSMLATFQGVQQLEIEATNGGDRDLLVEFTGDQIAVCTLLRQLVLANMPVLSFTEETDTLEDVFMKLTQGIVS
jgi:ABC-2 type transport system ATP-binding protein